jgi:hypothetical protein
MRARLLGGAGALALSLCGAALAQSNSLIITQTGTGDNATLLQGEAGNQSTITQTANTTTATVNQGGSGDVSDIIQNGSGNTAMVTQNMP